MGTPETSVVQNGILKSNYVNRYVVVTKINKGA